MSKLDDLPDDFQLRMNPDGWRKLCEQIETDFKAAFADVAYPVLKSLAESDPYVNHVCIHCQAHQFGDTHRGYCRWKQARLLSERGEIIWEK